jgi:DNA mismatch endonuclease (patch repair protein)
MGIVICDKLNKMAESIIKKQIFEQRRKNMSHIKSCNTSIEILLRRALWHAGIRYRKNFKDLPGKPDIAITKYKIAVFCDGEFWHGKDWETKKNKIKTNRDFWISKIERNIIRDNENDKKLMNMGWVTLHFWGDDINRKPEDCLNEIKETIFEIEHGIYSKDYTNAMDLFVAEDEQVY